LHFNPTNDQYAALNNVASLLTVLPMLLLIVSARLQHWLLSLQAPSYGRR
jgi:hypothetical protein